MQSNPKAVQAQKEGKVRYDTLPWEGLQAVARVMGTGADKYGRYNFFIDPIKASTYVGAIARHTFDQWANGEDVDKDSGEHPLAHVAACCLIVMASEKRGTLIDDRLQCESKNPETGETRSAHAKSKGDEAATPAERAAPGWTAARKEYVASAQQLARYPGEGHTPEFVGEDRPETEESDVLLAGAPPYVYELCAQRNGDATTLVKYGRYHTLEGAEHAMAQYRKGLNLKPDSQVVLFVRSIEL